MAKRVKTDQIPSTPDELYVQLYCERKCAHDEETIQKARLSWESLTNAQKRLFEKTIEKKNCLNYAHGLSKSKIYLKERKIKKVHSADKAEVDQNIPVHTACLVENPLGIESEDNRTNFVETQYESKLEPCNEPEEASIDVNSNQSNALIEEQQQDIQSTTSHYTDPAEILVEPVPPTVRTGKEFYEVVKSPEDPQWTKVPDTEKNRYNRAVITIKRDYIKSYMKYLESLPQQQLFDHYMKTLH